MPPKVKITKKMVEDASIEVIRKHGHENLNARTIAEYLGCSTQPVLYSFKTVDEIREAAYVIADEYHTACIMPKETDEKLAEKLFVSRTAISKWESGRGYPIIDSLKAIAKYFHITIDELICGEEIVELASQDIKESNKKYTILICGILDCLIILLMFLPVFRDSGAESALHVWVFGLTEMTSWIKITFMVVISLTAINGFCTVVISNFDKPVWNKHRLVTGMFFSVMGTVLFILTRQPYAGIFYLFLLALKGVLVIKSK